jgi:uncharacterized membrane protein YkvA (DUF1232 family)
MATKFMNFEESMMNELTDFIRSQANALSLTDFDRLVSDLPALRERFAKIPLQTYPYLSDQLNFLGLFVEEQVVGRNRDLAEEPVAEAAFALLYFQRATDLIPDPIPNMGLLDDAMIVSMVLRRQEHAFKRSSHSYMLRWPEPKFDVDQLLSVISPLRVISFCSPLARQPPVENRTQSHWR